MISVPESVGGGLTNGKIVLQPKRNEGWRDTPWPILALWEFTRHLFIADTRFETEELENGDAKVTCVVTVGKRGGL